MERIHTARDNYGAADTDANAIGDQVRCECEHDRHFWTLDNMAHEVAPIAHEYETWFEPREMFELVDSRFLVCRACISACHGGAQNVPYIGSDAK